MEEILNNIVKTAKYISFQNGILKSITKAERMNDDPKTVSYGISCGDTTLLGGTKFEGQSSGCNYDKYKSYMASIGETVERYCPAFYDIRKMKKASYTKRDFNAVAPDKFAKFHPKQIQYLTEHHYNIIPFKDNTVVYWDKCMDLTNGQEVYCPAAYIYLPWHSDDKSIFYASSTGLAAHFNKDKALLASLYEVIERDSFVLTWFQKIVPPKIIIDSDIKKFLQEKVPGNYEWNFFDITYDLGVPTVFGICCGESDYGKFISVSTATRNTLGEALRKTALEIQQAIPYFRYELNFYKDWQPSDNFNELMDFRVHSIFYLKRPEYQNVFDCWRNAKTTKKISFYEYDNMVDRDKILKVIHVMKALHYNVLFKDLTTIDVLEGGFHCFRIVIPQLLPLIGAYPYYMLGNNRLYSVPAEMGYKVCDFDHLNHMPHPFP